MRAPAAFAFALLLLACSSAPGPSPAKPAPSLPRVEKSWVLRGEGEAHNDLQVNVLLLEGREQALIQITRWLTPLEDKVILHEVAARSGSDRAYRILYKGKLQTTLFEELDHRGGRIRWTLWIPPYANSRFALAYDPLLTEQLQPQRLVALHLAQRQRGELEALARFDREEKLAQLKKELQQDEAALQERCGQAFSVEFPWESIPDQSLRDEQVVAHCSAWLLMIRSLCETPAARSFFTRFKQLRCQIGERVEARQEGDALILSRPARAPLPNEADLLDKLKRLETARGRTLAHALMLEKTLVCLGEGERAIVFAPEESEHAGLSYGVKGAFFKVTTIAPGSPKFFEPRYSLPTANPNFRGWDWRYVSEIEEKAGACVLRCGLREVRLKRADLALADRVLAGLTFVPNPFQRTPHALARDQRGTYYYVDRPLSEGQKDYRVFIGPRGSCTLQQMKNIVADSEGQIFATAQGKLKLIVGKHEASWVGRGGRRKLLYLPIKENLELIYNQLGPYIGQRLGTPCDEY